jgi:rRNA maturation RNase YbeY
MAVNFYSQDTGFLPAGKVKTAAWLRDVVRAEGYRPGHISLIFCSPVYHLDLNRKYLGHDYHTDVITFDYGDSAVGGVVSGDIFIDPVRVRQQAAEWDTAPGEELMRIMLHGILHLCGHDDRTPDQTDAMRAVENKYLDVYLRSHGKFPVFNL